ncbi:CDP-alcohol phosphatidyltransferase family protein [Marinobacter lacisalsi]|uniref:CDP-diacylglycerol--glycerol-3-phosphate 3-phosphatidyltransferase n=1 Tax=Marinobacter lacisalsi TaxID=475979 RepID=A0ABV8QEK7_9GAMM
MLNRWRWIPNGLTLLRILLVLPFAWSLANDHYRSALVLFFVAAATDGLDGLLARMFGWKSRLGAIADPLADKLLLVVAYLMLSVTGVLPIWLFLLVLGRDLVIVAGGLVFHRLIGPFDVQPSILGKLNTLVQILAVLAVMLAEAGFPLPARTHDIAVATVAGMAVISGVHYVGLWGLRALRSRPS